jgi:hypothetical protein
LLWSIESTKRKKMADDRTTYLASPKTEAWVSEAVIPADFFFFSMWSSLRSSTTTPMQQTWQQAHKAHTHKKTLKLKHLTQKKKKKASKTLNPFWLRRRRKNKDSMGKYLIHYVNGLQGYKILFKANPSRKGQFGIMPNFCKSRSSIHCPLIIPNNYVDLEWLCEILPHCIYVVWRWFNRDMMWICFSHFGIQRDFVFQCFVNDLGILSIY